MESTLIILFVQAVISSILSYHLANQKGYEATLWAMAGFFFGVLGLIAAAGLPLNQPVVRKNNLTKNCPACAETIILHALVCKYCGNKFDKSQIIHDLSKIIYYPISSNFHILDPSTIQKKTAAINALINFPEPNAIPPILKYIEVIPFNDGSSSYSGAFLKSLEMLININAPSTSNELAHILNKTTLKFKAERLVKTIAKINDPECLPILIESLQNEVARDSLANSLPSFGTAALPYLEKFSSEGSRSDAKLAQQIIAEINNQK